MKALTTGVAIFALTFFVIPTGPAHAGVGNTVYLPNITRMLGGPDGWQTPFIGQNVGSDSTSVTLDLFQGPFHRHRPVVGWMLKRVQHDGEGGNG